MNSHLLSLREVDVSGLNVCEVGDKMVEGLAIDDQTGHAVGVIGDDVGRALLLPETRMTTQNPDCVVKQMCHYWCHKGNSYTKQKLRSGIP